MRVVEWTRHDVTTGAVSHWFPPQESVTSEKLIRLLIIVSTSRSKASSSDWIRPGQQGDSFQLQRPHHGSIKRWDDFIFWGVGLQSNVIMCNDSFVEVITDDVHLSLWLVSCRSEHKFGGLSPNCNLTIIPTRPLRQMTTLAPTHPVWVEYYLCMTVWYIVYISVVCFTRVCWTSILMWSVL